MPSDEMSVHQTLEKKAACTERWQEHLHHRWMSYQFDNRSQHASVGRRASKKAVMLCYGDFGPWMKCHCLSS